MFRIAVTCCRIPSACSARSTIPAAVAAWASARASSARRPIRPSTSSIAATTSWTCSGVVASRWRAAVSCTSWLMLRPSSPSAAKRWNSSPSCSARRLISSPRAASAVAVASWRSRAAAIAAMSDPSAMLTRCCASAASVVDFAARSIPLRVSRESRRADSASSSKRTSSPLERARRFCELAPVLAVIVLPAPAAVLLSLVHIALSLRCLSHLPGGPAVSPAGDVRTGILYQNGGSYVGRTSEERMRSAWLVLVGVHALLACGAAPRREPATDADPTHVGVAAPSAVPEGSTREARAALRSPEEKERAALRPSRSTRARDAAPEAPKPRAPIPLSNKASTPARSAGNAPPPARSPVKERAPIPPPPHPPLGKAAPRALVEADCKALGPEVQKASRMIEVLRQSDLNTPPTCSGGSRIGSTSGPARPRSRLRSWSSTRAPRTSGRATPGPAPRPASSRRRSAHTTARRLVSPAPAWRSSTRMPRS